MRRVPLATLLAFAVALAATPADAQAPGFLLPSAPINACSTQSPAFTIDDLGGVPAPCAVAMGSVLVETLYYQNASRVGGTALAEYPLFRIRAGLARRLEAVVDTPSQIAESGLRGAGLYPTSHAGYGLNYTFAAGANAAAALGVEMLPPGSRFTVNEAQPRYVIDLTGGYHFSARGTVSAIASGSSSRQVGFNRIFPAATVRVAYDTSSRTQLSTDVGMRFITRHAVAQSFGDVSLDQRLRPYVTFALGVGTTFNSVSNQKAHYLASGFNFRIK